MNPNIDKIQKQIRAFNKQYSRKIIYHILE